MLFLRESLILHKLDHTSIVKFIGINFKSFSDNKLLQPTIITEYLPHGSLKENLDKERKSLSDHDWTATKKYINLIGISDAMRYLHKEGIVHRDLKPANILIDSNYYPRVCDFGISKCFPKSLTKSMNLIMTGQSGTPLYLPPEILRGEEIYDQSVDVYAFGIIAYEIVTGKKPFSELGEISPFAFAKKVNDGYRPKFTDFVTEKMQRLISRCWSDSQSERPTFDEIFNELSNDMSYFSESIDEKEIKDYLELLSESSEKRQTYYYNENENKLKAELNELKTKLLQYQDEHDSLSKSKETFHDSIISLLEKKEKRCINKTIKQLKISSEQGNRYASFILGYLYEVGDEIEQNISESFKYYDISTKQGYSKGLVRKGICYKCGIGVKQDYVKAIEFFEKAAELYDAGAFNHLGIMIKSGLGVEKNYIKAKEYYEKAVELGNTCAFNNLGNMFRNGLGVEQNYIKAKEYYEKAAEFNDTNALVSLGNFYANGYGVDKNIIKANEYFNKAVELGNEKARKYIY